MIALPNRSSRLGVELEWSGVEWSVGARHGFLTLVTQACLIHLDPELPDCTV